MKKILLFLSIVVLVACSTGNKDEKESTINEELLGGWSGNIDIPGSPLLIELDLQSNGGAFSVPIQGLKDYPFEKVAYDDNSVTIKIDLEGSQIIIKGSLQEEEVTGTFTQDGQSFPVQLVRFMEEAVSYEQLTVPVAGGELNVAIETPESEGPYPLAIIIAGSGPTDKDGNTIGIGKNDSLKMIAEQLADEGIASIRYDKRGIGDNAPLVASEEDLSIEDYIDDVEQIISYIQSDSEFTDIHILGHSEGSLVGMLAANSKEVTSFVSLAGAGRTIDHLLLEQIDGQLSAGLQKEVEFILNELKNGHIVMDVPDDLLGLFRPSAQPYMISWLKHNPAEVIKEVDARTLLIQGTNDLQVTTKDVNLLKDNKQDAEIVIVDGMNHILKDSPASENENIATYTDPTIPLSTEMIKQLLAFLKEN